MQEYMAFDPDIPVFYRYKVSGYTPYNSSIRRECSISVFIRVILMNKIIISILFICFKTKFQCFAFI